MERARRECTKQLLAALGPEGIARDACMAIEESCWSGAVTRCGSGAQATAVALYVQACMNAVANLSSDPRVSNGNAYLLRGARMGAVDPTNVAWMSSNELNPARFAPQKTKCFSDTTLGETDQFECPRCSARRCVHYELQTRSADEATTVFVSCVSCGHKWTE